MAYTWEEIEQDWLEGSSGLAASADEALVAFNEVAARFGRDWVEATRTRNGVASRGMAPTLYIVTLGRLLRALDGVPNTAGLLEKLRQGDQDARAELIAIYLMRIENPPAVIEAEPEVQVGTRTRKPDFRAQIVGQPWTYVEVTNPNASDAQADVLNGLQRLTGLVDSCSGNFALEVFLKREPTAAELDLIASEIGQNHETAGQSILELPEGLGTLYWNQQQPGAMVLDDHGEPYTPRFSSGRVIVSNGDHRHIIVRWPYTDTRVETFIRHEARQLPTDTPGLIMIFTSGNVGAMKAWRALIERRFQPTINTRVSGVCLFSSDLRATDQGEDWHIQCKLLLNPHATHALPSWIAEQLQRFPSGEPDT
jgi:hypothetical protein